MSGLYVRHVFEINYLTITRNQVSKYKRCITGKNKFNDKVIYDTIYAIFLLDIFNAIDVYETNEKSKKKTN